jgi:isopentenyl-diphosphate delta-isomerase
LPSLPLEQANIEDRKKEGIMITLNEQVQARETSTLLECVHLVHNALPELDFDEIDTSISFLGHKFSAPILIDSMTGGTPAATKLNEILAKAAANYSLGMGVGSQRAGLKSGALAETYRVVRRAAPETFVMANIGGAQLADNLSLKDAQKLVEMIDADALAVHLNPLQEIIQPEGEPKFEGVLSKIKELSSKISVPIIVKEVGAGISKEVALRLIRSGAAAINVSGLGGTSWAGVEQIRARASKNYRKAELGQIFWDWGIPTAASLIEVRRAVKAPLIASGGLRNGLDIAKCIVLGANLCGMALPMLKRASESFESLCEFIEGLQFQLQAAMFLVGAKNVKELSTARHVITGDLVQWSKDGE